MKLLYFGLEIMISRHWQERKVYKKRICDNLTSPE